MAQILSRMVPNVMRLNLLKLKLGGFMHRGPSTKLAIQVANRSLLEMALSSVNRG